MLTTCVLAAQGALAGLTARPGVLTTRTTTGRVITDGAANAARLIEPLVETGVHWPCGFSGWIPALPDAEWA
jgi:hypothetical protein